MTTLYTTNTLPKNEVFLPNDLLKAILLSSDVDEKVIEKMKMTATTFHNLLNPPRKSYWQARLNQGTLHTYEDIAQIPKYIPDLKHLSLVDVRQPNKSWRVAAQLPKLNFLQLHCQIDFNPPGKDWRKNHRYDYLKRCDGSIPYKRDERHVPEKLQETYDTVQLIATLTSLKGLELHPGPLFIDNISHFAKLTNLERLYTVSSFYQWDQQAYQIHLELLKLSNLRELNFGFYHEQVPDRALFPFLRSFQHLKKLELRFLQPHSQFLGLGQLTTLEKLSLRISDTTVTIFQQIRFLTKLTILHLHAHTMNFKQIPFQSVMDCVPHLQHLREFYIKAYFEQEALLASHLFSRLPNFQKFIAGSNYVVDSSQPEGYRTSPCIGNYGGDFWDRK